MADRLEGLAPAKINLVLEVTGLRPDGYHEIDTVLQALSLADRVAVSFGDRAGVSVSGPFARGTPADDSNLAWRAAADLAKLLSRDLHGLQIALDKQIPAASGLGGGASDAATVLRLLAPVWGARQEQLFEAANAIGSDEAFFLVGTTARARGRGERVEPLLPLAVQPVVLFIPNATIERKTARMFAAIDRFPFDPGGVAGAFAGREPGSVWGPGVFNAFERVAFEVFPGLASLWEDLEHRIGDPIHLAGAGPTLFWIGTDDQAARRAAAAGAGLECLVIPTSTAGPTR